MDSYFQKETTLFQEVVCGNINSHNEPSVYIKLLLANGVDVTYQDAGIKSVVELLTSSITPSIERAKMILSTGKIDIEKPVIDGKSSVLDCVKEKYFVAEKSQDYLYQYYKSLSPEKAERWYRDILAERHRKEELERREEQKRQELAEYKRKQQNQPTADDYVQALHIASAALGVMSAFYGLVATAQKCQEQYEIANSPVGRFKRMLGIKSY